MRARGWGFLAAAILTVAIPTTAGAIPLPNVGWRLGSSLITVHDFGSVDAGSSSSQAFTLTNVGGRASRALRVSLTGSPSFTITQDSCSATSIGPRKSCTVTVQYAPTTGGPPETATLTALSRSVHVSLVLNGVAPNRSPIAVDDEIVTMDEFVALALGVLDNDSDPDVGDTITIVSIASDPDGLATIDPDGADISYDTTGLFPLGGYNPDTGDFLSPSPDEQTFTYTIMDSHGATDTASARVLAWTGQDYNAICIPLVLSSATVSVGDTITVSGTTTMRGAFVQVLLNDTTVLATATSDSNGFWTTPVTIPLGTATGSATLRGFGPATTTQPPGCPSQVAGITVV